MTTLLAALPIVLVLVLMIGFGWPAARAGTAGAIAALVVALSAFGFGRDVLADVGIGGGLTGVVAEATFTSATILWIVLPALAIHQLQVGIGATEVLREALGRLSGDPIVLALLIGWFFALFIEGAAGFGASVALAAPFLVGVGYQPLQAVVVAMIGHAVGVSFGAVGTPVVAMLAAVDLDPLAIGRASATYHLVFGIVPLVVMVLVAARGTGSRPTPAIWGWTLLAAFGFLVPMWLLASFVGPELPTMAGSLIGGSVFVAALLLVRRRQAVPAAPALDVGALVRAASPYLTLVGLVVATRTIPAIGEPLARWSVAWTLPGGFSGSFTPLTHPGTLLALAFLGAVLAQRVDRNAAGGAIARTLRQLGPVTIALVAMLLLARLMVRSEMTATLAETAAGSAGAAWPLLAPLVGVLGTFVTGSATASNILFTDLQAATAAELDLPAVPLLGAQNFGAGVGNAVCPHNIVAAGATVGLVGAEGDVLRRTLGVTLVYALLGGVLALLLV
ncbi:MAG: L-lactate permease [Nitriliruptoraceae bacterium]|nr:L-lactate permease [Nitriliruptoraceae bacterium]